MFGHYCSKIVDYHLASLSDSWIFYVFLSLLLLDILEVFLIQIKYSNMYSGRPLVNRVIEDSGRHWRRPAVWQWSPGVSNNIFREFKFVAPNLLMEPFSIKKNRFIAMIVVRWTFFYFFKWMIDISDGQNHRVRSNSRLGKNKRNGYTFVLFKLFTQNHKIWTKTQISAEWSTLWSFLGYEFTWAWKSVQILNLLFRVNYK